MWTSVILAGRRDSRPHSTAIFCKNVVVTEESKLVRCFVIQSREGLKSVNKKSTALTFLVRKAKWTFMRFFFIENKRIKTFFQSNLVLVVVLPCPCMCCDGGLCVAPVLLIFTRWLDKIKLSCAIKKVYMVSITDPANFSSIRTLKYISVRSW